MGQLSSFLPESSFYPPRLPLDCAAAGKHSLNPDALEAVESFEDRSGDYAQS
jgi:hypothetical protein